MDISILGYKFDIEILILIGIIFIIMSGHLLCGCCNYGMIMEGFDPSGNIHIDPSGNIGTKKDEIKEKEEEGKIDLPPQTTGGTTTTAIPVPTLPVTTTPGKEGFAGANINYGESSIYDLSSDDQLDTSSWSAKNMTVVKGQPVSAGVKAFMARPKQQIPLPEGEMFMFANTKFAPEYCPNTYSTSQGCAAMTGDQYNYLMTRGGNNVPYSEY